MIGMAGIALVLAALSSAAPAAEPFGFRDLVLGMPLADARRVDLPVPAGAGLHCSDEAARDLARTAEEAAAGVIRCRPGKMMPAIALPKADPIPPFLLPSSLDLSAGVSASLDLRFLRDRLYAITLVGQQRDAAMLMAGLRERFGPPTQSVRATFTDKYGPHPGHIVTWSNGAQEIVAEVPMTRGEFAIRYSIVAMSDEVASKPARIKM